MGSSQESWQAMVDDLKDYERMKKELDWFITSCGELQEAGCDDMAISNVIDRLQEARRES